MSRPAHLVWRGSVLASAYVLDDSPHARAQVLARWRPGHEVFAWPRRLVWRLPEPERVRCEAAPGLPLVEQQGRLTGAPLEARELASASGGALISEAGQLVARPLAEAVDPSQWLDLSAFSLEPVATLGETPAPPQLALVPRPATDARTALGFAPLQPEAAAVAESLRTGAPLAERGLPPGQQRPITIGPLARGAVSALRSVSRWFSRVFSRGGGAAAGNSSTALAQASAPPGVLARLNTWLDRLLDASRLSRVLGQRQADYLSRLMQMFEQGDLDAALRHAIPLGGQAPADSRPSHGVPTPRDSLDIPLRPSAGAGGSIQLQLEYYEQLRRRYRAAAEKLEADGRYAEAAFVLAELLHADEEAIALLERHGKLELAAELAEARQMAPGMQVRQWFLAKNVARAVAVARRHGVFGDAVARLSRSGHEAEAKQLRLLWADHQASSGDFYNAVVTVWPLNELRPLVLKWMDLGIAAGGVQAARLSVKRLVLGAEDGAALHEALDSDAPERQAERSAILTELEAEADRLPPTARPLARAALRSSVRDAVIPSAARLKKLHDLAADGALKVDLPPWRTPELRLAQRTPPARIDLEAWDKGALAVSDAALLPDGRMLLALGEVGVRVLTRDGRTAAHHEVPTAQLVTCDHGGRALCLARRGDVQLVTRLDLATGKTEPLKPLQLQSWAEDTDGSMWFVHDGTSLCALDLHSERLPALWRVGLPRTASRPMRNALSLSVRVTQTPQHVEWWRYELPSLTLRVRQQLQLPPVYEQTLVLPDGNTLITQGGVAWHQVGGQGRRQLTGLAGGVLRGVEGAGDWFSLLAVAEGTQRWMLVDRQDVTVRHVVQLPRAAAKVRMQGDVAVYCDEAGRVLVVNLTSGLLLRDLRVR